MFLSQKVKRNVIIAHKNGKYELTDEWQNNVRLKKSPWNYSLVSSLLPKMKILPILAKIVKTRYRTFPHRAVLYMKS